MTGKQLYEASHLYLMIAMDTENVWITTPQNLPRNKDDLSY
jgi:hypothetical protein